MYKSNSIITFIMNDKRSNILLLVCLIPFDASHYELVPEAYRSQDKSGLWVSASARNAFIECDK